MAVRDEIRSTLNTHLAGTAGIPAAGRWSNENVEFDPGSGQDGNWVRVTHSPGFRELFTFPSTGGWVQTTGLMFVDLFFPMGAGPSAADTLAAAVEARFPPGQEFTLSGSRTLRITRSLARGGFRERDWYHVPVEVGWEIQTVNALV